MSDKSSRSVLKALRVIFSRHGIPVELTSDNVPFNGKEFLEFSREYGFRFRPISLTNSNVRLRVKNLLRKSYDLGTDPQIALLNYRAAPYLFRDRPDDLIKDRMIRLRERERQNRNYDGSTRILKPLEIGDTVRIKHDAEEVMKGQVVENLADKSYLIKK